MKLERLKLNSSGRSWTVLTEVGKFSPKLESSHRSWKVWAEVGKLSNFPTSDSPTSNFPTSDFPTSRSFQLPFPTTIIPVHQSTYWVDFLPWLKAMSAGDSRTVPGSVGPIWSEIFYFVRSWSFDAYFRKNFSNRKDFGSIWRWYIVHLEMLTLLFNTNYTGRLEGVVTYFWHVQFATLPNINSCWSFQVKKVAKMHLVYDHNFDNFFAHKSQFKIIFWLKIVFLWIKFEMSHL